MHILHLSLPHVVFSPFRSCLAYFMPSGQFLSSIGKGVPAMYLSTDSNSRGDLCPKLSSRAGTPVCQTHAGGSTFSQTYRSSNQRLWVLGGQVNYLSFNWFTAHRHYCHPLQNSAGFTSLSLPTRAQVGQSNMLELKLNMSWLRLTWLEVCKREASSPSPPLMQRAGQIQRETHPVRNCLRWVS